jgi:hypothetical protein
MRSRTWGRLASVLATALLLGACGSAAPSATPVPTAAPTATPDPHLTDPVSVDVVIRKLAGAGIRMQPNNASAGRNGEPVKAINFTYDGWPLIISQFSSSAALRANAAFDPSKQPRHGDATYKVAGLNILIEYGPGIRSAQDPPPDPRFRSAAMRLVDVLDPLLGPLQQASLNPLPLPEPSPSPTLAPSPTASPKASAAPTKKPSAKPTAKPKATPKPTPKP